MDIKDVNSSKEASGIFSIKDFEIFADKMTEEGLVLFCAGIILAKIGYFWTNLQEILKLMDIFQRIIPLLQTEQIMREMFLQRILSTIQKIDKRIKIQNQQDENLSLERMISCGKNLFRFVDESINQIIYEIEEKQQIEMNEFEYNLKNNKEEKGNIKKLVKSKRSKSQQKETFEAINMILDEWKQLNPAEDMQNSVEKRNLDTIFIQRNSIKQKKSNLMRCGLCERENNDSVKISCRHKFHQTCLSKYIKKSIQKQRFNIKCPKQKCSMNLSIEDIKRFSEDDIKQIGLEWKKQPQMDSFLKIECPTAVCTVVFQLSSLESRYQCPQCLKDFCMTCKCMYHEGKSCEEYQSEMKIKIDHSTNNSRRKKAQLKECPKCKFWVQKVSGFNCLQCKCGVEFCLKCGGTACQRQMCFGLGYKKKKKEAFQSEKLSKLKRVK